MTDNGSNFVKAFSVFGRQREIDTDGDDEGSYEDIAIHAVGDLDDNGHEC